MATAPVKSQPLHNFPLSFLKWGGTTTANNNHPTSNHHHFRRPKQLSNNHETDDNNNRHTEDAAAEAEETIQKPWNLRPRRQPAVPVIAIGAKNGNGEVQEPVHSVAESNAGAAKSLRVRGDTAMMMMMMQCGERKKELKKKNKFWIALSKEEIEEDIFVMTGSRPNRRPKKRPKNVQKQMDSVFPGLWLLGVSADVYKVEETPSKRFKIAVDNCTCSCAIGVLLALTITLQ